MLSGCASTTNDELSGRNTNNTIEEDLSFPYYGEFKIVHTADVQQTIGVKKKDIVIVQDEVTGCKYISNNSVYLSLSPLYDETGKVKGCRESIGLN